ncbi:putative neutral zinc metallopeptidase [Planctomycetes bacterium CA13]|uniref:Putative neutral zinc metallopeptidase n=1 Tax=Novipirellula herctigrandis TaxID=2527986 RepID=A0A5C5Z7H6_9BACT|nr:putative neutral zinc metallopeptidase [Planctomycetes bacterium CA13]
MMLYFLFVIPPFLLGLYAQWRVKSAFTKMSKVPSRMSGFQAARTMLDNGGLESVGIEQINGMLSDHYDPRAKVLRLSSDVYNGRSMAAVGVACHEAGHAFQDAHQYAPLVVRNIAVPAANFGSGAGMWMLFGGMMLHMPALAWLGVILFSAVVFFQVINLPVEFNASSRAREELVGQGIISGNEEHYVASVLNAAALTYVAATLQSILTLAYYVFILTGNRR